MSSGRTILVIFCSLFIFTLNLHSQELVAESEATPLQFDGPWTNNVVLDTVQTIVVDGVLNALSSVDRWTGCGDSAVASVSLDPGLYVVGITGGPGIQLAYAWPYLYDVCFYIRTDSGSTPFQTYHGLSGLASPSDPGSYHVFTLDDWGHLSFFAVDAMCADNAGYVEVTLARIVN